MYERERLQGHVRTVIGRSRTNNRWPVNRYSMEKETESVSTLAKNWRCLKKSIQTNPTFGYRFINFVTIFSAISQLVVCKKCGTNVSFNETNNRGIQNSCQPREMWTKYYKCYELIICEEKGQIDDITVSGDGS